MLLETSLKLKYNNITQLNHFLKLLTHARLLRDLLLETSLKADCKQRHIQVTRDT